MYNSSEIIGKAWYFSVMHLEILTGKILDLNSVIDEIVLS